MTGRVKSKVTELISVMFSNGINYPRHQHHMDLTNEGKNASRMFVSSNFYIGINELHYYALPFYGALLSQFTLTIVNIY